MDNQNIATNLVRVRLRLAWVMLLVPTWVLAAACQPTDMGPGGGDGGSDGGGTVGGDAGSDGGTGDAGTGDAGTGDGGGDTGGDDTGEAPIPPEISDVTVVAIPGNVLACRVTWTTDRPATSEVRFGPGGALQWKVSDDAEQTAHDLLVIGMHPDTAYSLEVHSASGGASAQADPVAFTSGTPPWPIVPGVVTVHDPTRATPGWTLMDLHDGTKGRGTALMIDMDGLPVWYYQFDEAGDADAMEVSLTPQGDVLLGGSVPEGTSPRIVSLGGEILWEGPPQTASMYDEGYMHHDIELLPDGNFLLFRGTYVDGTYGDLIEEITPEGVVVWSWNAFDWLEPNFELLNWTHFNWFQASDDFVWWNDQRSNTICKLDRDTGEIIWRLRGAEFELTEGSWFVNQHAPSWLADGHLLVFDNAGGIDGTSRVVEYEVDEDARTIREVWKYPTDDEDAWFAEAWGDADRLPNGNTLVTAGFINRIFEVTTDGDVVWDYTIINNAGRKGSYRSERIEPPLIQAL